MVLKNEYSHIPKRAFLLITIWLDTHSQAVKTAKQLKLDYIKLKVILITNLLPLGINKVNVCISADIEGVAGIAYDIPGVTVSIVKDDKRIFAKGYVKPK